MTGDDLIHLASHLISNTALGNPEARYRSAVATAFLADCNARVLENHTGHVQAAQILQATGVPDAMEVARLLDDLRAARNEADYKLQRKRLDSQASAQSDVEMAADIQSCLLRCRLEPTFSEITTRIQSIRRPGL